MPLTAQTFNNFGGLRLDLGLDEVGPDQAIDLLDVDWEGGDGALRPRDGASGILVTEPAENYDSCFAHGPYTLLARRGEAGLVSIEGQKEIFGPEPVEEDPLSFARIGTPTTSYTYIANGQKRIFRFESITGFSKPTATVDGVAGKEMPTGSHLTTWPEGGNRLVIAGASEGPAKATSNQSYVWFSSPGDPTAYESTAYVQLSPGDGEEIVGCTYWNNQVFVFKETSLFIFYGVDTDEEGKPVFNFRTVQLPARVRRQHLYSNAVVAAGDEGVFFLTNKGIYLTTGSGATLISGALSPLGSTRTLLGPAAATFGERRWSNAGKGLFFLDGYLYAGLGEDITDHRTELLLRCDLESARWTVWSASLYCLASRRVGSGSYPEEERVVFSSAGDPRNLYQYEPRQPSDEDPTSQSSPRWQSGFYDLESEDEKTLTQARVWGTGTVDVKTAKDFGALGTGKTFTLGSSINRVEHQRTQTGVLHSHQFSGTGPWRIQRFVRYLAEERAPDTKTS